MPLVTATFSTGGSVVINEEVELAAITALTTAVTANTTVLEKNIGPASLANIGSLGHQTSLIASNTALMVSRQAEIDKSLQKLIGTLGALQNQLGTVTTGMAHSVQLQARQLTTTQLMAADQIKNNQFQQLSTNTALKESGKDPIVVEPSALIEQIRSAVQDVSTIQLQTAATSYVADAVTGTIGVAYKTSIEWAAQSSFGKWLSGVWLDVEANTKAIFSDKTAKEIRDELIAEKNNKLTGKG